MLDPMLDHEKKYLEVYLQKVSRYQVIGSFQESPVYSLYQPPLLSKAGQRALSFRLKRRFQGLRVPATATIAINKTCQCACEHCSAVFYNHHTAREMDFDVLKKALLESVELGVTNLILLGGEPLLRKDLFDLIASVPKDLSVVTLFTNGEYLTPEMCRGLRDAGLMGVFVSLDDTREEVHDQARGRPGLFRKALQGIENLKSAGILVALSSYLSPSKLKEGGFEAMMELGKDLGVHEITFFDAIPSGQWLRDTSCLLTVEDRQEIQQKVRHFRQLKTYPGLSVQSTMTSECGSAFCFAANTQFYLTAFGDMCPCDFTPLTIGRYPDHSIADLWKKMITTSPYNQRSKSCRMQSPEFRARYINTIPRTGPYPFPL